MTAFVSLPRLMHIGGGAAEKLENVLASLGLVRPLIITDPFVAQQGWADALADRLKAAGIVSRTWSDAVSDPTVASVEEALAFLVQGDHDCVVGLGGGSPIDTAKAVAVLAVHGGDMRRYKAPHRQETDGLPIIAVPTTAGTGSEATQFTVITDELNGEKMLCAGLAYLPSAALVDFEYTMSKPQRLTADTGIDALTHAIEAYVSSRATPFSDGMALLAMGAIAPSLRKVCADPNDREGRAQMMLGACQAGIAFSNSSVALVHGMSRPIGAHFHVPHGLSNAMLLPIVTAFSAPHALHRYATCARTMGVADETEGDQAAVGRLVTELEQLNIDLGVPTPRVYGIDEQRWRELTPLMARQAIMSGSPGNNPVVPEAADIEALYDRAFG